MNKIKKIYFIASIFGLTGILLTVFLIYPIFKEIRGNSQELISVEKELNSLTNKMNTIREFKADYKDYKSNLSKLDGLLINKKAPLDFIKFLESISNDVLFEISSISHSFEEGKGVFSDKLFFNISLKGPYSEVLRFLEKLENGPYLISIQNFNLRELSEEEIQEEKRYSADDVRGSILIKVFAK